MLVCLSASCKAMPEELVVRQKDTKALTECIAESEKHQQDIRPYIAEDTWQETIKGNTDKFSCIVDADIEIIGSGVFPVVNISPKSFTPEFINMVLDEIVPDGITLNLYDEGKMEHTYTKEEIEAGIISKQRTINDSNSSLNELKESDPKVYEEIVAVEIKALERLKAAYEEAPDETDVQPLVITDELMQRGFIASNLPRVTLKPHDLTKTPMVALMVSDCDKNGGIYNDIEVSITKRYADSGTCITAEEAIQKADDLMARLGITQMSVCAVFEPNDEYNNRSDNYSVYYSRDYEGCKTTYTSHNVMLDNFYTWPYETIEIRVHKSGELDTFSYTAPAEVGETQTHSAKLLPYDEIKKIFRKQINYECVYIEDEKILKREYHIHNIKLGMARIAVGNGTDTHMAIPVWDFFGYYIDTYQGQEYTDWQLDDKNRVTHEKQDPFYSIFTINAMDGTIIDRANGY